MAAIPPAERKAIAARRASYGVDKAAPPVGLALSGGGIRSATFSLGMLRGLSGLGLMQRIDFLSTVSGGGYAGSFYCGLFAARDTADGATHAAMIAPAAGDLLGQPGAQRALRYLRQSGRYLVPAGTRDYLYATVLLARNWLALTLVSGIFLLLVALLLDAGRAALLVRFPAYGDILWLSPLAWLVPPLAVVIFAFGWAYWLTMNDVSRPFFRPPLIGSVLILLGASAAASGMWFALPPWPADLPAWGFTTLAATALVALLAWAAAAIYEWQRGDGNAAHEQAGRQDRVRHRLTSGQAMLASAALVIVAVAVADTLGFVAARLLAGIDLVLPSLVGVLVPVARKLSKRLSALATGRAATTTAGPRRAGLLARYGNLLAWVAALVLGLAAVTLWGGIAHWLAWHSHPAFDRPLGTPLPPDWDLFAPRGADGAFGWDYGRAVGYALAGSYWPALAAAFVFVVLAACTQVFVNLSSLATFYAGRLRRAYLGASNPHRLGIGKDGKAGEPAPVKRVKDSDARDDLGLAEYYAKTAAGAPVHLINVTINATKGNGPATVQRDRHGINLVISPAGLSYSPTSEATVLTKPLGLGEGMTAPSAAARMKRAARGLRPSAQVEEAADGPPPGQSLALSTWVGISGAAFSTGLGSRTSLANAVLAYLANVRLGYWWKADRHGHGAPSYLNLYRELSAGFPGTAARQWYLSDGGHFENTGVYELIRREVPFIIAADNGCDPQYGFQDVANLVRKARIDLGAEIDFLDGDALDERLTNREVRRLFAAPGLFRDREAAPFAIAMLATIRFSSKSVGTLLVIKPRLTADGPADLMRYCTDNPDFPQQTTIDQFFDEAQWESYYELGRRITAELFADHGAAGWQPHRLRPLGLPPIGLSPRAPVAAGPVPGSA